MENWDQSLALANQLIVVITRISQASSYTLNTPHPSSLQRSITYYFGFGYLMQGLAYHKKKQYSQSLLSIEKYADLDWILETGPEAEKDKKQFLLYSIANTFTVKLLSGDLSPLQEYMRLLMENPKERLSGLITILEAAIEHNLDVHAELSILFSSLLPFHQYDQFYQNSCLSAYNLASIYYLKKHRFNDAMDCILYVLDYSKQLQDDRHFIRGNALFEAFRPYASLKQLERFAHIQITYVREEIESKEGLDLEIGVLHSSSNILPLSSL
ncbi:hypothetical protein J2Z69_003587 [Paenibacillus shirakamiensis]|uniref:DNA-binding protein n=1 Tax=Paenibacillus shirakamiensis TaxID=1265935 RepID=A0ABS4JMY0_9BACL|nr:hypothetical protein [Paenibacillus shirakamiensis]MBP2002501.1 hypothetical protein [Paenibacillus shirakamiensis]